MRKRFAEKMEKGFPPDRGKAIKTRLAPRSFNEDHLAREAELNFEFVNLAVGGTLFDFQEDVRMERTPTRYSPLNVLSRRDLKSESIYPRACLRALVLFWSTRQGNLIRIKKDASELRAKRLLDAYGFIWNLTEDGYCKGVAKEKHSTWTHSFLNRFKQRR